MTVIAIKRHHHNPPMALVEAIAEAAGEASLSKSAIKRALVFGGGWLKVAGSKQLKRCRKAKQLVRPGDYFEFYYDPQLLAEALPPPRPVMETPSWGIWYKPVNQLSQGSRFGEANSRDVCVKQQRQAPVHLIHRLDREASGLLMLAYTPAAAAALSQLWAGREIAKYYQVQVLGQLEPEVGDIQLPLDDKPAHTQYRQVSSTGGTSRVDVRLYTGRLHQIRRHFAAIGHPVLGDPRYGEGNHYDNGLQLVAVGLDFTDPCNNRQRIECRLPAELCLY